MRTRTPVVPRLLFHLCLTWTPHRKTCLHASKMNFPGPFPFLRKTQHGEAEDVALLSCTTSNNKDITPTHLLIAPDPAMQITIYTGLQDSLGSPSVLSFLCFMLTGTQGCPLRLTDKCRGFKLWSTWISMLAPLFSTFVFKCLCAHPWSGTVITSLQEQSELNKLIQSP